MMKCISPFYKKIALGIGIWFLGFCSWSLAANDYCTQGDLMQQAFCVANQQDTLIDLGHTKTVVGGAVVQWGIEIEIGGVKVKIAQNGSIIVVITKFLLMLTIVLAVTMIIFNGIQYIIMSGSGNDPKKAQSNLVYIVVGIVIALLSVVIINLLRSTGVTLFNATPAMASHISETKISSLV